MSLRLIWHEMIKDRFYDVVYILSKSSNGGNRYKLGDQGAAGSEWHAWTITETIWSAEAKDEIR